MYTYTERTERKMKKMKKQLYVIEYESSQWCGGMLHCVAWAESEDDAENEASLWMEESQRELFSDEYDDREYSHNGCDDDGECAYTVNSVQLMAGSEFEEYYNMPDQRAAFYPCVNA
jgi:hypothetical protein